LTNLNNYFLEPGDTYLLATRYNPSANWYALTAYPSANKLITANDALSIPQLAALAASDLRVQQLQAAYPNEIQFQPDVAHNNTLNSYESFYLSNHPIIPTSTTFVPASLPIIDASSSEMNTTSSDAGISATSTYATDASSSNQ
jgi:hypothetical protein